jgi:hypothetical protein
MVVKCAMRVSQLFRLGQPDGDGFRYTRNRQVLEHPLNAVTVPWVKWSVEGPSTTS